tara:strand:- start:285 stop:572 length:288 start_codon:yes stop_codon:yes gene_type:complete
MHDWGYGKEDFASKNDCKFCGDKTPCVNHQQVGGEHYTMPIEPIEFIMKNKLEWCESNAVKYLCRHRRKGGAEDVKKAIHYLQILLKEEYPNEST